MKWKNLVLGEYIVNPSSLIHFQFFSYSFPHSLFSIELFVPQAYQVFPIRLHSVSRDTDLVSENETKRRAFWTRFMFLQSKNFFISSHDLDPHIHLHSLLFSFLLSPFLPPFLLLTTIYSSCRTKAFPAQRASSM